MKFSISNLAMIKGVELDLSHKLTIFYGDNGAGKTCLSHIIYALGRVQVPTNISAIDFTLLFNTGRCSFILDIEQLLSYRIAIFKYLTDNISKIYGVSQAEAKALFANVEIESTLGFEDLVIKISDANIERVLNLGELEIRVTKMQGTLDVDLELIGDKGNKLPSKDLLAIYNGAIFKIFALYPITHSIVFSIERNSIFTFSKDLSLSRRNLAQQVQRFSYGFDPNIFYQLDGTSGKYSSAINDALFPNSDLRQLERHNSPFYDLAVQIENDLFGGALVVSKDGDLLFVSNKSRAIKQRIHIGSSVVKSFSSLILYLKHRANMGDLIIIDEPEMNLNSTRQIKLARIFCQLVKSGFRLLINTQSELIVREINNLMMVNCIDPSLVESTTDGLYSADMGIPQELVGLYLFQYQNAKSRKVQVNQIIPTSTGFNVFTPDIAIENQHKANTSLSEVASHQ